jgi:hemolysin activation/secretion protein
MATFFERSTWRRRLVWILMVLAVFSFAVPAAQVRADDQDDAIARQQQEFQLQQDQQRQQELQRQQ